MEEWKTEKAVHSSRNDKIVQAVSVSRAQRWPRTLTARTLLACLDVWIQFPLLVGILTV